jgi:hypothetical protein
MTVLALRLGWLNSPPNTDQSGRGLTVVLAQLPNT